MIQEDNDIKTESFIVNMALRESPCEIIREYPDFDNIEVMYEDKSADNLLCKTIEDFLKNREIKNDRRH